MVVAENQGRILEEKPEKGKQRENEKSATKKRKTKKRKTTHAKQKNAKIVVKNTLRENKKNKKK